MGEFKLDTSGVVAHWHENCLGVKVGPTYWSDLDAFTQGYVEALFASLSVDLVANWLENVDPYRSPDFRGLAPETLAAILKDCAAFLRDPRSAPELGRENGKAFWRLRQMGVVDECGFPPLAVTLGDDGKVYLRPQTKTAEGGE